MFKKEIIKGEPVRYCPRCKKKKLMCKCHVIPLLVAIRERGKKHDIKTSIKDMESNVKNGNTNKTHTMEEINE